MNSLDPTELFQQIANDIPRDLHKHLFVTGSLAAAYHYKTKLEGRGINTKDADLVVHPAGDTISCKEMTEKLKSIGWTNTDLCHPQESPTPEDQLRAIRLFPPGSKKYFVEFLNIPEQTQKESKRWIPLQMPDGWYGLPSFRFMSVASLNRRLSEVGIEYASPAMMALSNLLSHPNVGSIRIETGEMNGVLRSAKDLGRVISLARLEGRDETEAWRSDWSTAIRKCFPDEWQQLSENLGSGLQELIADAGALEDARKTTDIGLLNQMNVSADMLKATAEQLLQDVIFPLRQEAAASLSKSE